jgi:acetolactate synthase-1/2/3 large subunit
MPKIKLSDYVLNFLADQGIRHVFFLPGGGAIHLNNSLGKSTTIEGVCTLHEQAAAIAAEVYSRISGSMGVCMVTSGPGGTNAITGLAGAWFESTPVLFLSGQVKRNDLKRDSGVRQLGSQELDIVEVVKTMTKYAVSVMDPSTIRYHLEKAFAIANQGRKGPVWIDLPIDVQGSPIILEQLIGFDSTTLPVIGESAEGIRDKAAAVIDLLNRSERPVLLVGNGIRGAGAVAELRQLVEKIQIPVLRTWIGSDLLPDDHPRCFGKPGTVASRGANFTVQNSDLVIAIGTRLDFSITGFDRTQFARCAKKVVVDIDLSEIGKLGKLVDVPVHCDAGAFIRSVLSQINSWQANDLSPWIKRCQDWKASYPIVLPEFLESQEYINSYVFAQVLSEEMEGSDLILPGSSGAGLDTFWLTVKLKEGQRAVATGGLGAMGYGLPATIGGCLAGNGRRTISVDGDGGFQLNIQELATVARLKLPIKYFILNNNGYASIRASQRNFFKTHYACDPSSGLKLPDTCRIAEAYGIPARRIVSPVTLREDIRAALQTPGPLVCEVVVHPDQAIGPRISSVVRPDGSIRSRPLEDLFPFLERDELAQNMLIPLLSDE